MFTACSSGGSNPSIPSAGTSAGISNFNAAPNVRDRKVDTTSLLKLLSKQAIIGSVVDPTNGDQNPYGLAYVAQKPSSGSLKEGDLVVCNYNSKANVAGAGTSVVAIASTPGSKPRTFSDNKVLLGCASTLVNEYSQAFSVNSGAKNETAFTSAAKVDPTFTVTKSALLVEPWGSAYAPEAIAYPPGDGIFVSDASTGHILRIDLGTGEKTPPVTSVISGFKVNKGKPGSILGPSGLQYDVNSDTLYIVDGVTNTVVAIDNAYIDLQQANAITVGPTGKTFSGPKAKDGHVLFAGAPLNAPVSSTLLPNGNLIVGNTGNPNGTNLMVEIDSSGKLLDTRNVDKGAAGALFGIASAGKTDATTKIFFNDDNANNVQVLEK